VNHCTTNSINLKFPIHTIKQLLSSLREKEAVYMSYLTQCHFEDHQSFQWYWQPNAEQWRQTRQSLISDSAPGQELPLVSHSESTPTWWQIHATPYYVTIAMPIPAIMCKMTSSTKQEIINISQHCKKGAEPWPYVTQTKTLVKTKVYFRWYACRQTVLSTQYSVPLLGAE